MIEIKAPKKLIEVALPLDAISEGCQEEKNPFLKGHPRSVHLWWARRPLAAARAVLFAQLVNDPGYERHLGRGVNKAKAAAERERLFDIIRKLVKWENISNEKVLKEAREEIEKSWRETCMLNKDHSQSAELFNSDRFPALHDPFAGGGAIPLEAQRLGLEVYASDLNPVAVIINKAMIEIPPRFVDRPPIGPRIESEKQILLSEKYLGARGLAEDVRRYGSWIRGEAEKRVGHLYPQVEVTEETVRDRPDLKQYINKKLNVIAWLWARTVKSPNPAYSNVYVPLVSTFVLSSKPGKEAYLSLTVEGDKYHFHAHVGKPPKEAESGTKLARGANFRCIFSDSPIESKYIRSEAQSGRMKTQLMAIIAEGAKGKVYLSPTPEMERNALLARPTWKPDLKVTTPCHDIDRLPMYGMFTWGDAFTSRQLVALTTFSDLVGEAITKIKKDAIAVGMADDNIALEAGGSGAQAYAEAVGVYLATGISQIARYSCVICTWNKANENVAQAFGRQAIPMVWDFAEANTLLGSLSIEATINWVADAIEASPTNRGGFAKQDDARHLENSLDTRIFSTDPPYYDNIGYADLSDFFYVWLRRSIYSVFPSLFTTIAVPKSEELIASFYRHGSKENAEKFFLDGMTQVMHALSIKSHPAFPVTIYYAFKQTETEEGATSSTGWETFLEAVLRAGFQISGTWPMRTEKTEGLKGAVNALASCVILVCRKRAIDAPTISRREFIRELNAILPEALIEMTCGGEHSPVAPVDLSQAIIGPGMEVFSKYSAVLEADGKPMAVRTALQLINRFLAEDDFDHDTQFCLHWFETEGWGSEKYGVADVLARAKGTGVDGLKDAGVLESGSGEVRLLQWSEYPQDWNPMKDKRTPIWEALHHMLKALNKGGESEAGALLGDMINRGEAIRQLAYRLYTLCERKGWAEDARAYNELINSWSAIETVAGKSQKIDSQMDLFK